jgi:hypothetical protein
MTCRRTKIEEDLYLRKRKLCALGQGLCGRHVLMVRIVSVQSKESDVNESKTLRAKLLACKSKRKRK